MHNPVRLTLTLSIDLVEMIDAIADSAGASRSDVLRQSITLCGIAHETKRRGLHLGIVDNPSKLDTLIVGVL